MDTTVDTGIRLTIPTDELEQPVLILGVSLSKELAEHVAGYKNPHYLVVVASVDADHFGNGSYTEFFQQTASYIFPVEKTYQHIRFNRPGKNRVMATVVDIFDREDANQASKVKRGKKELVGSYSGMLHAFFSRTTAVVHQDVDIPKDIFAEPPSGWEKAVVDQVFPGRHIDQCDFRRKLITSLIVAFFIQLFGIVLRPLCLLLAVLMLRREIRYRNLLAFNPLAIWSYAQPSYWLEDKDGRYRLDEGFPSVLIALVSPPALAIYSVIFFVIPAFVFGVFNIRMHHGDSKEQSAWIDLGWWTTVLYTWLVIVAIGVAIAAALLTVRSIRWSINKATGRQAQKQHLLQSSEEGIEKEKYLRQQRINALLSTSKQLEGLDRINWEDIPSESKSLRLFAADVKRRACRPFAL